MRDFYAASYRVQDVEKAAKSAQLHNFIMSQKVVLK